jgi:hypothetical protein
MPGPYNAGEALVGLFRRFVTVKSAETSL